MGKADRHGHRGGRAARALGRAALGGLAVLTVWGALSCTPSERSRPAPKPVQAKPAPAPAPDLYTRRNPGGWVKMAEAIVAPNAESSAPIRVRAGDEQIDVYATPLESPAEGQADLPVLGVNLYARPIRTGKEQAPPVSLGSAVGSGPAVYYVAESGGGAAVMWGRQLEAAGPSRKKVEEPLDYLFVQVNTGDGWRQQQLAVTEHLEAFGIVPGAGGFLAWWQEGGKSPRHRVQVFDGASWGPPVAVAHERAGTSFRAQSDGHGYLAVWHEPGSGGAGRMMARAYADGKWGNPVPLMDVTGDAPPQVQRIAGRPGGGYEVVLRAYGEGKDVRPVVRHAFILLPRDGHENGEPSTADGGVAVRYF